MHSDFTQTKQTLAAAILNAQVPGLAAGIDILPLKSEHLKGERVIWTEGVTSLVGSSELITAGHYFDLASLTKLFTSTLFARLVDRGWIEYDSKVCSLLPGVPSEITFAHLLSHTAGYMAWRPFWEQMRLEFGGAQGLKLASVSSRQECMRRLVLAVKPDVKPELQMVYSDVSFLILGYALEELLGLPFDEALKRHLFVPLHLDSFHFNRTCGVAPKLREELKTYVATEDCPWRGGVLRGQVHDDNCWSMGGYAAHAGVFGQVGDVLKLGHLLLQEKVLQPKTLQTMWSRVAAPLDTSRTLGWDTPSGESSLGRYFSRNSVGHLGFTGVSLWIDIEHRLSIALLTNRVHPSRNNDAIKGLRVGYHEALAQDLGLGPKSI